MFPFLTINPEEVHHTLIGDGAEELAIHVNHYCGFSDLSIIGNEEAFLTPWGFPSVIDSLIPINSMLSVGTSNLETSRMFFQFLEAQKLTKEIAELSNFLSLTLTLGKELQSYELSDILFWNGKNVIHKPPRWRYEALRSVFGKDDWMAIKEDVIVHAPVWTFHPSNEIANQLMAIMESDPTYFNIEIYGNKRYAVFNPYIGQIERLAGCRLRQLYATKVERKYRERINEFKQFNLL